MANNYIGSGATFSLQIGSTYTVLGTCTHFTLPKVSFGDVDVTTLATGYKKSRSGIPDPGSADAELQFDPADTTMTTLVALGTTYPQAVSNWKITYTDAEPHVMSFAGFVKELDFGEATVEGLMTLKVSVRLTSLPTVA